MPIHDWTRVKAGIHHDFHQEWIAAIKHVLNKDLLPPDHYALSEQLAGGFGPDVLTLEGPARRPTFEQPRAGIALAEREPKVSFRAKTDADIYATKANRVAVRHVSDHRVVAVVEIVSPGNKSTRGQIRSFIEKAVELIRSGVHLMVIDPFPPGPGDPQGLHRAIWEEFDASDFLLPVDRRLTIASYIGGASQQAFVEPVAVGSILPEMPLFLSADVYVQVPLEATYQTAWGEVPRLWQDFLETART